MLIFNQGKGHGKNVASRKRSPDTDLRTDFEKVAKLRSAKLGLDLNDAISQLTKERS